MKDALTIERMDQATVLLKPLRIELMQLLARPSTCTSLAEALNLTPQKVYYHIKVLEKAGLVEKVEEHRIKGIMEGVYQACAATYLLSPSLVRRMGGRRKVRSDISISCLLDLGGLIVQDAEALARQVDKPSPSMSINAGIALPPEQRKAFLAEVQELVQGLARRYGAAESAAGHSLPEQYKLLLACYPAAVQMDKENVN